jgi:biopolymer transport protein ExbD
MRARDDAALETPVSALIDVVFQLIIFFVVTAAIDRDVVDESIRLAQAKYVAAVEKNDPRTVLVNVAEDGAINIAMQPLNLVQLQQILSATRTQSGDSVPIVIRADGTAIYRHVDGVMQAVGKAGMYRVQLSALSTGEGKAANR